MAPTAARREKKSRQLRTKTANRVLLAVTSLKKKSVEGTGHNSDSAIAQVPTSRGVVAEDVGPPPANTPTFVQNLAKIL
jgi:hypothetical protein